MPPAVLTADRLRFLGTMSLGVVPYPSGGEMDYAQGMAAKLINGQWKLHICSFNPQTILEFAVPTSFTGVANYVRNLGSLPTQPNYRVEGLHWYGDVLFQNSGPLYAATATVIKTLSRGSFDATGTTLVSRAADIFSFANRSGRFAQGGTTTVPDWFRTAYLNPTYTLASGFGGYFSGGNYGPVSMGPALCAFAPPADGTASTPMPNTPFQGYPFHNWPSPRQHRTTNLTNEFGGPAPGDGFPVFAPDNFYFTWCDEIWGGGAWVDTPEFSGFVTLGVQGTGCCFYGHNDGTLSPCANSPGVPATINSTADEHVWRITAPADLALVAQGALAQTAIQSTCTTVQIPGVTYPLKGAQGLFSQCTGAVWLPTINKLLTLIRFPKGGSGKPVVKVWEVIGGTIPPPATLTITTTSPLPGGTVAKQYVGATLSATGGVQPYTWSATTPVPTGLALSSAGSLTGTPTISGAFTVEARVTDTQPVVADKSLSLTISAPPPAALVIDTTTYGSTEEDRPFSATAQAHGGTPPYTWTFGAMPIGLSGNTSTGVVSGTPTTPGSYTIATSVTDTQPVTTGPTNLPLTVTAAPVVPTLTLTTTDFGSTEEDKPFSVTAHATGGIVPYVWAFTALPTGLSGNTTTGVISGTPTTPGVYSVQVTVTDARPVAVGPTSVPLIVTATPTPPPTPPPVITTSSLPVGTVGALYQQTLAATSSATPLVWACSNTPGGLALSTTGVLSGIPTTAATTQLAVMVTDTLSQTTPGTIPLTIAAAPIPAPVITTTSLADATVGTAYLATLAATGGVTPLRWSATNLPDGLALSTGGVITGLATTPAVIDLAVTVTDAQPLSTPGLIPFTVLRADPPVPSDLVITTSSLPNGTVGIAYSTTLTATGGTLPYVWTCSNLPNWLTLTPDGVLQGMPTSAVTLTLSIGIADSQTSPDSAGALLELTFTGPAPDPGTSPPDVPIIYLPKNRATKVRATTTNGDVVRWWGVQNADGYQVYHGTTPTPPLLGTVTLPSTTNAADFPAGTYFFPVTRATKTTYYWRIVAFNGGGVTTTPIWRYRTA